MLHLLETNCNHARQPAEKISFPRNGINLIPHSKYKCPNTTLPTGCALDTQQPATHPPTGQYLGCVWVLALTETPLGFKRPHWLQAELRPASSENLAAMFLQIQLDIGAESLPGSQNCTNCYCLAPVRPAANARNRQKSKRQQINASKSDWICQNIPTGTQHVHSKYKCPKTTLPTGCALDTQQPATHPPTGQHLCCVWVLALTETPLGFKRRHWLKAGYARPQAKT